MACSTIYGSLGDGNFLTGGPVEALHQKPTSNEYVIVLVAYLRRQEGEWAEVGLGPNGNCLNALLEHGLQWPLNRRRKIFCVKAKQ